MTEVKSSQSEPIPVPDPIAGPPSGRARALASGFIAVWLLFQLAVPISYYFGADPTEERFAWRMFSDIAAFQRHCTIAVSEVLAPAGSAAAPSVRELDLARTLHLSWELHLRRNRRIVVDRFVRWRCAREPGLTDIDLRRTCPVGPESRVPPSEERVSCGARDPSEAEPR